MVSDDVGAVASIARIIHHAYPEDGAIFAERQALYPQGCRVLARCGRVAGYVLSHPWHYLDPPALNVKLGALPGHPTTYYIHDLALLPESRGSGAARMAVEDLIRLAASEGLANMSLIAVGGTPVFWGRYGFTTVDDPAVAEKLRSYDAAARYMARAL